MFSGEENWALIDCLGAWIKERKTKIKGEQARDSWTVKST